MPTNFSSLLELFLVGVASFVWVYLRRRRIQRHSLANLPGPEAKSWWKGMQAIRSPGVLDSVS